MKTSEFIQISDNHLTKWFWFCAGVIILSKLLLIGKNEIIAMPHDSLEYIRQVAYGINSIGSTPKGYPLWLWITNFFGAPQRLVIELLYLLSSLMLAHTIGRVTSGKVGLFVLLFLFFSPNSFFLFDKALSDGFYMCLTLAGVALSVSIIYAQHGSRDYWIKTITLGLTLGLMLITRNEEPLIVAWVVWLILMLWRFVWHQEKLTLAGKVKSALSFIGTLAVVAYGVVGAVLLMHYLTNGVAAGSLATLPGHVELLKNLARIDTQEESVRFVPISKKARGMAYDVSPALRELKLIIESPENPYQVASRQHHLPEGEIGAGWIWHVFNNAAFSKIGGQGVRGVDAYYGKINHELETAFSRGTLQKTFVIHPLFGKNLFVGVDYFPSSLLRVVGMSLSAYRFQPDMGTESGLFDRICLRRTTLADSITRQPIQGWTILDKPGSNRVESVLIETEYGQGGGVKESSLTIATEMQRYDVVEGYKKAEGRIPAVFGFRAELGAVRGELKKIIYVLSDGRKIGVEAPLKKGISSVDVGDSNFMIIQGFDLTGDVMTSSRSGMGFKIQNTIISISEWIAVKTIIGILVIGGLLFSVVQIIRGVPASIPRHLLLVVFISGIVIFRIGFYTLIDAAAWSIDLRYLAPANALLLVIFALVLAGVSRWVWGGLVTFVPRRLSL